MLGPWFYVTYGPSIDDGDAWYFRVEDGSIDPRWGERRGSDRLHVVPTQCDYMAGFRLVETSDPPGLAEREALLAAGLRVRTWSGDSTGGETCAGCANHVVRRLGGTYHKCRRHETCGAATDIRVGWPACDRYVAEAAGA